jgi:hypothetical protein
MKARVGRAPSPAAFDLEFDQFDNLSQNQLQKRRAEGTRSTHS